MSETGARPAGNALRGIFLGVALLMMMAYYLPQALLWMKARELSGAYVPVVAFAAVILLLALRRLPLPTLRLSSPDILAVFCVLAVGVAAFHVVGGLIAMLPAPYFFATPENDYRGHFLTTIPGFLVPFDPLDAGPVSDAILRFYRGSPDGQGVPWEVWAEPLAWWSLLLGMLLFGQLCLGCLLRRQWLEHEKLMFPHIAMVTSLVDEGEDGVRHGAKSSLFFTGVGLSVFIFLLEGLSYYEPTIPSPGLTSLSLRDFLVEDPWRSMDPNLAIQPYLIAISYLLTTEISFSIWFFALLDNLMRVLASALTLPDTTRGSWVGYSLNSGADAVGAIAVFLAALAWRGRGHYGGVLRRAFGLRGGADDSDEAMGYRLAFWGTCFAVLGVLSWCVAVGIPLWFAMAVFGIYALLVLFVTRLVGEIGLISATSGWLWPPSFIVRVFGYRGVEASTAASSASVLKGLSILSFVWPTVMLGPHLLPLLLSSSRASEGVDVRRRRWILWTGFVGLLAAIAVFSWQMLEEIYARGALNSEYWAFLESGWVFGNTFVRDIILKERAHSPDWTEISFIGMGAGVMSVLLYLRSAFYWWPLHPIGYITTGIHQGLWFSIWIGWFVKRSVLKYGGGGAFQRLIPFFIGLFVGHLLMAGFWIVVGLCVGEVGVHLL